jgi:hypothetical protein
VGLENLIYDDDVDWAVLGPTPISPFTKASLWFGLTEAAAANLSSHSIQYCGATLQLCWARNSGGKAKGQRYSGSRNRFARR